MGPSTSLRAGSSRSAFGGVRARGAQDDRAVMSPGGGVLLGGVGGVGFGVDRAFRCLRSWHG